MTSVMRTRPRSCDPAKTGSTTAPAPARAQRSMAAHELGSGDADGPSDPCVRAKELALRLQRCLLHALGRARRGLAQRVGGPAAATAIEEWLPQAAFHFLDAPVDRRVLEIERARRAGEALRARHREHRAQRFPVQAGCASLQAYFARIANFIAHAHILSCAHRRTQGGM